MDDGVVAGGWIEAPPQKTKQIKNLLEELGWLSRTTQIRSTTATGANRRLLPLTDSATAALCTRDPFPPSSGARTAAREALEAEMKSSEVLLLPAKVCKLAQPLAGVDCSASAPAVRFVDLFAGVGGFRLGLEAAGAECVWGCEIDPWARKTYAANFGAAPVGGDITRTPGPDVPEHDLLVGGFPCQPFSGTGKRRGISDERDGRLFLHVCRLLNERRPAAFILENVRGLLTLDDGAAWSVVRSGLAAAGYTVRHKLFEAADVLPQYRSRLFIVGFRTDVDAAAFAFPELPQLARTVGEVLEPPEHVDARHRLTEHQWQKVSSQPYFKSHPDARLAAPSRPATTLQSSYKSGYLLYSQFVPDAEEPDAPPRFYTPRECARLQGFPETFKLPNGADEGRWYRQIGNAVPPPLVAAVATRVLAVLRPNSLYGGPWPAKRHRTLLFDTLAAATPDPLSILMLNAEQSPSIPGITPN